jgi:hypothetical protein
MGGGKITRIGDSTRRCTRASLGGFNVRQISADVDGIVGVRGATEACN